MSDVLLHLKNAGYSPSSHGDYYRMKAIYRGGDNETSLSVHKKTGKFHDFATGENGTFQQLMAKTGGDVGRFSLENLPEDDGNSINVNEKLERTYDVGVLKRLLPHYDFYEDRGISRSVLEEFQCGLAMSGKMYNRIVFPIFNQFQKIHGFSGRDATGRSNIKWKHVGRKNKWIYPRHLSEPYIQQSSQVILVEGISDVLALYNTGIRNCLSLFGLTVSPCLTGYLTRFSNLRCVIATNNESSGIGNEAAQKIKTKLLSFFSEVDVKLPPKKDFGECSRQEILSWRRSL